MTAALLLPHALDAVPAEGDAGRVQVLESRPGAREVLLVTSGGLPPADDEHAVIVLERRRRRVRRDVSGRCAACRVACRCRSASDSPRRSAVR